MNLEDFTGGINSRKAPHLIAPSQSQDMLNVDTSAELLEPAKLPSYAFQTQEVNGWHSEVLNTTFGNDDVRNYIGYKDRVIYSNAFESKKLINEKWYNLGINGPPRKPSVRDALFNFDHNHLFSVAYVPGKYFTAEERVYRVVEPIEQFESAYATALTYQVDTDYKLNIYFKRNFKLYRLTIAGSFTETFDVLVTAGTLLEIKPEDTYSYNFKFSTAYKVDDLIRHGASFYKVVTAIASTNTVHVAALLVSDTIVSVKLSTIIAELLENKSIREDTSVVRKLEYVYTYYNETDDTESPPSAISEQFSLQYEDTKVDVFLSHMEISGDEQVTHIFIYRLGAGSTVFRKIAEVPKDETGYHDTKEVDDPTIGQNLSALGNNPPRGLKYLTKVGGTFFGVSNTRLYFSKDLGNPNYWPATNYIEVGEHLTSLAVNASGLVIFSEYKTFLLVGNSAVSYSVRLLHGTKGCINHNTVVPIGAGSAFVSNEGLQLVEGSGVKGLTSDLLAVKRYDTVTAALLDDVYYVLLKDRTMLAVDTRFGKFRVLRFNYSHEWIYRAGSQLMGQDGTETAYLFKGERSKFTLLTKKFGSPLTTLKTFNKFTISCKDSLNIKVFIDDRLAGEFVTEDLLFPQEFSIPSDFQRGASITFEISGGGVLYALHLDEKITA